ncbi:MAG: response regulator transcription factor [Eubacteriaceae bacterium]|nr:response regulator transcription factor [Eubacteriaceae bacterium]MBQ1466532.1 response regulator transcription factor [Eubacteriaceae bacterium]MCR4893730.1 response regulator transcription factor [Eubacteriales bacterium]
MSSDIKILVAEDDRAVSNLISTSLKAAGYRIITVYNGNEAVTGTASHSPDIILLDLGLPDIDGIEVIKKIRGWTETPIIVISARTDDPDKIEALDAGADDYLTKPFSVDELMARIRATLRRLVHLRNAAASDSVYENGPLRIDYSSGCVYLSGEEVHLTALEYKLLSLLARNTGKVLTHRYIIQNVWGSAWESDLGTLRVFMASLRKKLGENDGAPRFIATHIGIGYRMMRID